MYWDAARLQPPIPSSCLTRTQFTPMLPSAQLLAIPLLHHICSSSPHCGYTDTPTFWNECMWRKWHQYQINTRSTSSSGLAQSLLSTPSAHAWDEDISQWGDGQYLPTQRHLIESSVSLLPRALNTANLVHFSIFFYHIITQTHIRLWQSAMSADWSIKIRTLAPYSQYTLWRWEEPLLTFTSFDGDTIERDFGRYVSIYLSFIDVSSHIFQSFPSVSAEQESARI